MSKYIRMIFRVITLGAIYIIVQKLITVFISLVCFVFNIEEKVYSYAGYCNLIIILSVLMTFFIYFFTFQFKGENIFLYCKFKITKYKTVLYAFFLGMSINILAAVAINFIDLQQYESTDFELLEIMIKQNKFIISILLIGIIVPIFEEILFRGLIFNELKKGVNIYFAVILQALVFGAYHGNLIQGIFTSILGVVLGITYIYTESIWVPIFIHIGNNCLSIFLSKSLSEITILSSKLVITIIILSILVLTICIRHIISCKPNNKQDVFDI